MVFSNEMSIFVKFFKFLSFFPYSSNIFVNNLLKVYSIIILLILTMLFALILFVLKHVEVISLHLLIVGVYYTGILITTFISVFQALATRSGQRMIYEIFEEIDCFFRSQLSVNINYRCLRKRLLVKYLIIFSLVQIIDSFLVVSVIKKGLIDLFYLCTLAPFFLTRLWCLQIMFYVDLLNGKINLMNTKLENIIKKDNGSDAFILVVGEHDHRNMKITLNKQLSSLKEIYGRVWDISTLINYSFGWSLLAIVKFRNLISFILNNISFLEGDLLFY